MEMILFHLTSIWQRTRAHSSKGCPDIYSTCKQGVSSFLRTKTLNRKLSVFILFSDSMIHFSVENYYWVWSPSGTRRCLSQGHEYSLFFVEPTAGVAFDPDKGNWKLNTWVLTVRAPHPNTLISYLRNLLCRKTHSLTSICALGFVWTEMMQHYFI